MAKKILLLKTGSTHAAIKSRFGDFEDWFMQAMAQEAVQLVNAVTTTTLPRAADFDGIVITGSPAMVTDREPWSEQLAEWLATRAHTQVPVLGVCYGHQLLAHALGGAVDWHPQGREIGTTAIHLTTAGQKDPLLGTLPATFVAQVTHAQRVNQLPQDAILLASNAYESHHAFRVGDATWGLQFHPEFSADIMRAYVQQAAGLLQQEQRDAHALLQQIAPADANDELLRRFVNLL